MPVLDTNFLIALRGGDAEASDLLQAHRDQTLYVPDIVAAEFLTDWRDAETRAQILAGLASDFTLCHGDAQWIDAAAGLRAELRAAGRLVRTADVWIAAWARRLQTTVITRDASDFDGLADVVTW